MAPTLVVLVPWENAFNALFNGAVGEALPCSQQKLQGDQYISYSYRHTRSLHIIKFHLRNTDTNFPMKCGHLSVERQGYMKTTSASQYRDCKTMIMLDAELGFVHKTISLHQWVWQD